jgi:acetyl esterase/lipase
MSNNFRAGLITGRLLPLLLVSCVAGCADPRPVGIYQVRTQAGVRFADRKTGPLKMDIGFPVSENAANRPAVLWLHGGGYALGSRRQMADLVEFTASLGYVSATADYRLTTEGVRLADIYADARDAYLYLRKNATDLGIDPDRISVGGESAGGHLALLVGLKEQGVRSIIDLYGPTDLVPFYDQSRLTWKETTLLMAMGKTPREDPEAWRSSSPVNLVSSNSPPVLIMHGTKDDIVPFSQARLLRDRLRQAGARVVFAPVNGADHGWVLNTWGNTSLKTLPLIAHFLCSSG